MPSILDTVSGVNFTKASEFDRALPSATASVNTFSGSCSVVSCSLSRPVSRALDSMSIRPGNGWRFEHCHRVRQKPVGIRKRPCVDTSRVVDLRGQTRVAARVQEGIITNVNSRLLPTIVVDTHTIRGVGIGFDRQSAAVRVAVQIAAKGGFREQATSRSARTCTFWPTSTNVS